MHDKTDLQLFQEKCARADSLQKLYTLAVGESLKFSDGCGIVCGPISTGGRGKIEENIRVFEATIRALQQQGMPIFSQIPYEDQISLLCRQWRDSDPSRAGKYYMPVLDEFYGPAHSDRTHQTVLVHPWMGVILRREMGTEAARGNRRRHPRPLQ